MRKLTVLALGGNALIREGEQGTFAEQRAHVEDSVAPIARIAASHDLPLMITHGNGPIVGRLLLQEEAAKDFLPVAPLHVLDAESQGSVGFMIQHALSNLLMKEGVRREVVAMVTRVVVDPHDSSFRDPTKPVGPFYGKQEAERLSRDKGWVVKEDAGRGYRRRVPSPRPLRIPESGVIGSAARRGTIVIAVGGGGIPVREVGDGTLEAVDAVVDKDLASSVLGLEVGAERLLIMTAVDAVYSNFGTPNEERLGELTCADAERLLGEGQFPAGSMGPKMEAAIQFLRGGGREVRIGVAEELDAILAGEAGTVVYAPNLDSRAYEAEEESAQPGGRQSREDLSPSFRLTAAFLEQHPRYRRTLSLTPSHYQFDPVLWRSSIAALGEMLRDVADSIGLDAEEHEVQIAIRNLVEGVVLRSERWNK